MDETPHMSDEVHQLRESSANEEVVLLVGATDDREKLANRIRDIGGEIEDFVGPTGLRVRARKMLVDDICSLEGIQSIDIEQDLHLLHGGGQKGNSHTPPIQLTD